MRTVYGKIDAEGGEIMAVSESKRAANDRYDSKTYVQFNVRLRIEDDADIIKSISAAHGAGLNNREWLRELFDDGELVQTDKIKSALEQNGLSNEQIAKIMRLL